MTQSKQNDSIDAVITWVDGNDEGHREKRCRYSDAYSYNEKAAIAAGRNDTRFLDNGELYFCLRSIRRFAPWVRRIFLVTDKQCPEFLSATLQEEIGVEIVDHKIIFDGFYDLLPTFNSRAIETMLWRIPTLSDRFIYLNDDFVFLKEFSSSEFFTSNNVVLRGEWKRTLLPTSLEGFIERVITLIMKRLLRVNRTQHLLAQKKGARAAGVFNKYFRVPHVPHPMRTATLREFFAENESKLRDNSKYRFRSAEQFWTISLADHLEIKRQTAKLVPVSGYGEINPERQSEAKIENIIKGVESGEFSTFCLAAVEKLSVIQRERLFEALESRIK